MGWFFQSGSRDELIKELIESRETEQVSARTVAHSLRGNVLWSVVHVTVKQAGVPNPTAERSRCYIACDLLQKCSGGWGHKPLNEAMHPYYYTCPLRYLRMAPATSPEWRERVLAYHSELKAKRVQSTSAVV